MQDVKKNIHTTSVGTRLMKVEISERRTDDCIEVDILGIARRTRTGYDV